MRHAPDPLALFAGGWLLCLTLAVSLGPVIFGFDAFAMTPDALVGPGAHAWLGTDELGRSVAVQLLFGGRTSLAVGLSAAFSATVIGVAIGALSAFAGPRVDNAVMRVTEFFQVMPSFILAAVIVAVWGPGTSRVTLVIALLSWPQIARLMRGEVIRIKTLGYVDAARCLGVSERTILWREIAPNALPPVITVAALIVGQAILLEAGLSYFGLTSPDVASWGKMLNSGLRFVYGAWWLSVFPGVMIFLTVLAFNLLGDALAEHLDPRRGGRA